MARDDSYGFIGIDVGTQGVRLLLSDAGGTELFSGSAALELSDQSRQEQDPLQWWGSVRNLLGDMQRFLNQRPLPLKLKSLAVTSTSGTVIPLDAGFKPLHSAIMYSDQRSAAQGARISEYARAYYSDAPGYTQFSSSSGLSKMLWFVETFPEKAEKIALWVHAADFITGQLSGEYGYTDPTNALKSGYDVEKDLWPAYIYQKLPFDQTWLQKVVPTGQQIGLIRTELVETFGLPEDLQIVSGSTDGCASQVASGAVALGDWNTTIGTTMVIKGITQSPIHDPQGRIYSHRHPQGYWMPGGASNLGADWVKGILLETITQYSREGAQLIPTNLLAYPLQTLGERFPFIAPEAKGFAPEGKTHPRQAFLANMEGVAYIERYAYELIETLSGESVQTVFSAGGGSSNPLWMRIRSNVLQRPVKKMRAASGAFGAAVMAASQTYFDTLIQAADAMTHTEEMYLPEKELSAQYEQLYQQFIQKLKELQYIQ